ncbi:YdiU family protein [Segetibacter sp. 3557_3]|uniref:protein adenylyltransferase SelO n=1 Tax=Segetibacter sp. 3557_3 TaxID=2547429 RepID=UPI0010584C80|nr:YdiU family protein [Segetibacter sp. 3557_3]TDH20646.1 YdiU family protein [Segetibacter sp. 3557_3]
MKNLVSATFRNDFVTHFDGDESGNTRPRQTPGVLYSKVAPTPVKKVSLLAWSDELARELELTRPESQEEVDVLGGNQVTPSMYPYAACYAGHQFGNWAGQLGDGRAITLGELQTSTGQTWELQLKGPGLTPYSRMADGRAVLRSSLREYLMSEAMHYLGVPTTRALSLVTTGDLVMRDMFYNGNPEYEPGAIVMRVAPTFIRFGNFEILAARRENENLQKLVDWTIDHHYPHIQGENKLIDWYKEVVERTAGMIVEWMRVGFVHGVMNTDNMSILGLTIDYGPYSFVDDYDVNFTPNTTDLPGRRYAFGKQPAVAKWNLACLAGALSPLVNDDEKIQAALETYDDVYWAKYYRMMGDKLGFNEITPADINFINRFEKILKAVKLDMTIFFQLLIDLVELNEEEPNILQHFNESFYRELKEAEQEMVTTVITSYLQRIKENGSDLETTVALMRKSNPRFILRNYLLHQSIEDLEKGDSGLFQKLQEAIKDPYSNRFEEFFVKRPSWATQKAGCSMLSCSS